AHFEAGALERREQQLAGRAGVGGRFEHDQLPPAQRLLDRVGGGEHVVDVGVLRLGQRRRDADRYHVRLAQPPEVRGGGEFFRLEEPGDRKSTRLNSSHVSISYAV